MGTVTASIAVLVVLIVIVSVVIPTLNAQNTSGLDTTQTTIYNVIPTFLLLGGGLMLVVKYFF